MSPANKAAKFKPVLRPAFGSISTPHRPNLDSYDTWTNTNSPQSSANTVITYKQHSYVKTITFMYAAGACLLNSASAPHLMLIAV